MKEKSDFKVFGKNSLSKIKGGDGSTPLPEVDTSTSLKQVSKGKQSESK